MAPADGKPDAAPVSTVGSAPPPPPALAAPAKPDDPLPIAASPEPTQTAALNEDGATTPSQTDAFTVPFAGDTSRLTDASRAPLERAMARLKADDQLRVQLMAYAGGAGLSASKARRLSLSRALTVRSFLIDNGVKSSRIDVRALGDKIPDGPSNRVDLNIIGR